MLAAIALSLLAHEEIHAPSATLAQGGYYSKQIEFEGMPILASDKVEDRALFVARSVFAGMLRNVPRSWVRQLGTTGAHFSIIAAEEQTLDLPEYRYLRSDKKTDWNKRARGFGGSEASAGEENILEYRSDRYYGASIVVHEFAHTLDSVVFSRMDPRFRRDLASAYRAGVAEGLWKGLYTGSNVEEYWAGGVQCYFDCNYFASPPNGIHNEICNRRGLERYDPRLFRLIDRAFDHNPWRYPGAYNQSDRK